MARIANPRLQKTLVGNVSLGKLHWGPQHSCLLGVELAGWLDRANLTDGHGFGTPRHAVHLTGGRPFPPTRPQKKFFIGLTLALLPPDPSYYPLGWASSPSLTDFCERPP